MENSVWWLQCIYKLDLHILMIHFDGTLWFLLSLFDTLYVNVLHPTWETLTWCYIPSEEVNRFWSLFCFGFSDSCYPSWETGLWYQAKSQRKVGGQNHLGRFCGRERASSSLSLTSAQYVASFPNQRRLLFVYCKRKKKSSVQGDLFIYFALLTNGIG